ncbi:MAG TPA: ABC transporter permease [Candidatus Limnocylindrales bacterium]|nr:ABC transporter permease [Candidatus Limnocylindrales bacterium]
MAIRRGTSLSLALGAGVIAIVAVAALVADVAAPAPNAIALEHGLTPPHVEHPLGQDKLGRDVLGRLMHGARVSLLVALGTVAVSVFIGVGVGAVAGFAGGALDFWLMRLVDVLLAFPGLLLTIALAAALGAGLGNLVLALSVIGWTGYARVARAEVMALRGREHVEAAIALGARPRRVLVRHVLPMAVAPLLVQAVFGMAGAVVAEASLSFLGLGVQPPTPSWGSMLAEGRSFLIEAPYLTVAPGIAITLLVLGLNLLGDGLRDLLDVRMK